MVSAIDPTKPTTGTALTADVRANFQAAKNEIEALQSGKQPQSDRLAALVALTLAANKLIYATSQTTFDVTDFTAFARSLLVAADAAAARTILGAASTAALTGKQDADATLTALAGLVTAANKLIYATGVDTFATADLTAFARTLLDDPDAATALSTLGAAAAGHTHTAAADIYAAVKLILTQGSNVTVTANDTAKTLTVASTGSSGSGAVSLPTLAKSSAYTVTTADAGKLILCSGSWTLSLPAVAVVGNGFTTVLKNSGTGNISLTPSGSETIDSIPGAVLAAGQSVFLISDGTQWLSVAGGAGFTSAGAWSPTAKSVDATLSNNNLTITFVAPNQWRSARASSAVPTGKYYWEVRCNSGGADSGVGIVDSTFTNFEVSLLSNLGTYRSMTGDKQNSGGASAYGATWTAGDVIGVALDTAAGRMWFRKNGVWQASGDPVAGTNAAFTNLSGTIYPAVGTATNSAFTARFKQSDWGYAAPSGFSPLP